MRKKIHTHTHTHKHTHTNIHARVKMRRDIGILVVFSLITGKIGCANEGVQRELDDNNNNSDDEISIDDVSLEERKQQLVGT